MDAVTVDGTVIDFAVVEPDGFKAGDVHPVLLAMPPGGQDRQTTEDVVDYLHKHNRIPTTVWLGSVAGQALNR